MRAGSTIALLIAIWTTAAMAVDSNIHGTNKYAWSTTASWLNCRPTATNGVVIGQYYCSGWMYGSTCGWISWGAGTPTNGYQYSNASTTDYGVNHDGKGHLTGYAWSSTYGWINFSWTNNPDAADAPKVALTNGYLSGYAWGGSLGWISLASMRTRVQTTNFYAGASGGNGIPDAWEYEQTLTTGLILGGTNDYDQDGVSDYNEYLGGTNPTNPADFFTVWYVGVTNGTNLTLQWTCEGSRLYTVETNGTLTNASGWADCGVGVMASDTSGVRTLTITCDPETQLFYRVKSRLPLSL